MVESRESRNWGLRIADCGWDGSIPRYAVDAPNSAQPPAPSPQPWRAAISLTEVLIAMGILTLGLLGVASIFPVGSWYIQKADIADRGSSIAQSVMSDIVARGMLNPSSWYVLFPPASGTDPARNVFQPDGNFTPSPAPNPLSSSIRGTFTRPFALSLREALTQTAATDPTLIGKQFGAAYVIDPMGVAAMAMPQTSNGNRNMVANPFPSGISVVNLSNFYGWQSKWGNLWPIRRVTFQANTGWPLNAALAEHYFRGSDDLAFDLPQRADRPAQQKWDVTTTGSDPLARQWTGDYSWIVTVAPTSVAARDGMATSPESFDYDVSVVVFYKRVLPSAFPNTTQEMQDASAFERATVARIVSTGLSGGEILLEAIPNDVIESPFKQLKVGQWIMMCGPHPNTNVYTSGGITKGEPRFVLNWYKVISIDAEGTGVANFNPATQRVVSVSGPQWPWQPAAAPGDLSNNLCAAICRGAVAVHTKTMRLQSGRGSWGEAMSLVSPTGGNKPYWP